MGVLIVYGVPLTEVLLVITILTIVYLVLQSVIQYWRLRKCPGPPLAAWTNLWLFWHMNTNEAFYSMKKRLHQQYGPVQRYGPNRIMFSDASAIPVILGTGKVFPKADNYESLKAYVNGSEVVSFLALTDDYQAAQLKRNLHATFSVNGVLKYETHVDHTISELLSHLRSAASTTDVARWFSWFSFDTMARIAFSEDQGFMKHQKDIDGAISAARERFVHWNFFWAFPRLEAIIYKNWYARNSKKPPSGLARLAVRAIENRKVKGSVGTHDDFLDLYLQSGKTDPRLFTPSTIIGLTITTIHAGSETTAYSMTICLYHLLKNPGVLAKLRTEIESVAPDSSLNHGILPLSVLRSLPYLEACFKESDRLWPLANIMSERVVTDGGAMIAGIFVPQGTIVAVNTAGINTDPSIWGSDVDVYRPDRWLVTDEEQRRKMNRANLQFSAGRRMCLGVNVAWMEMRKVISTLLMNFEMELAYPEEDLKQSPGIFGVPKEVKVRLSARQPMQRVN